MAMSVFIAFLREAPGWFLLLGIFLPFAVLLFLIIAHLRWKLAEVDAALAEARGSRDTALRVYYEAGRRTAGRQST